MGIGDEVCTTHRKADLPGLQERGCGYDQVDSGNVSECARAGET